ncbi:MAG: hypothetical protein M1834_008807 [Cirrosporium novae-zelandiae]|nr:MAG: hypothetical protein M1834_008807 [Cirrosporium novae-zelandiae]
MASSKPTFMTLPREIRLHILDYLLVAAHHVEVVESNEYNLARPKASFEKPPEKHQYKFSEDDRGTKNIYYFFQRHQSPTFLHSEASYIFHAKNIFEIDSTVLAGLDDLHVHDLQDFASKILLKIRNCPISDPHKALMNLLAFPNLKELRIELRMGVRRWKIDDLEYIAWEINELRKKVSHMDVCWKVIPWSVFATGPLHEWRISSLWDGFTDQETKLLEAGHVTEEIGNKRRIGRWIAESPYNINTSRV